MNSLNDELKNFPKIDLASLQEKGVPLSEDVRNAVALYNSAIDKINSNNTDIAIIELKKAISIFPEFYDAILLLGVCVFYSGNRLEAINIFNSIRDDEERKRAISYLEELAEKDARKNRIRISSLDRKPQETAARKAVQAGKGKEANENLASEDRKFFIRTGKKEGVVPKIEPKGVFAYEKKSILDNPMIIKGMAYIAALLVIVCLFSWAVQSIRKLQMNDSPEFIELENKYKEEKERADNYQNLYEGLIDKNSQLYSKYILPIINQKYNEGRMEELVELLYLLDIEGFTDPKEKDRVKTIYQEVMKELSETAYAAGQNYYNMNDFNRAIEEFEKIVKYNPDFSQIHWVLLNLGKAYRNIGENEKAIAAFDRLIKEHPDTDAAKQAVPLLNQLLEETGLDRTPVSLPTVGGSETGPASTPSATPSPADSSMSPSNAPSTSGSSSQRPTGSPANSSTPKPSVSSPKPSATPASTPTATPGAGTEPTTAATYGETAATETASVTPVG